MSYPSLNNIVLISKSFHNRRNPQDETDEFQLPNFTENRQLKYLTSELSKRRTHDNQAAVYLHYIKGCKFNTKYNSNSVIRFDDNDARCLSEWAVNAQGQRTEDVPQVFQYLNILQMK